MMSDRVRSFETLAGFLDQLRRRDYSIGIDQYIAAHRLLLHLFDNDEWPDDPKRLALWLAPILCSSPEEQEGFYAAFSDWVDTWQDAHVTTLSQSRREEAPEHPAGGATGHRRAMILKVALGVSALLALAAVLLLASRGLFPLSQQAQLIAASAAEIDRLVRPEFLSLPITQQVRADSSKPAKLEPGPVPIPVPIPSPSPAPATISLNPEGLLALKRPDTSQSAFTSNRFYRRIAATALPGLFIGGLLLWGAVRRLQLKRNYTRRTPPLERLRVKGLAERFFNRAALRAAAQQLRRHRLTSLRELSVEATIHETTRKAGWFTPVYTPRKALPEYLVLIDRASLSDHQGLLDDELINQLSDYDVILTRYYFNGDPRLCRQAPGAPALRLETLEALHPNHGLLIFSDGAHLIQPLTRRPQPWLDMFAAWPERALFTHQPPDEWDRRERALEEAGFTILPATEDGIAAFVRVLQTGRAPQNKGYNSPLLYPDMLRSDPDRWVEDETPPAQEIEMLRVELQYYLGLEGYYWLAACALYPRVLWGITLFLGQQLSNREEFNQRLVALVRLPWFRHGTMPEWLRSALVLSLPAEQEKKIRKALDQLLLSALENPEGFELELANELSKDTTAPRGLIGRLLGSIKDRIREIRNQHSRRAFLNAAPADSPLRDYVFLSFLSGQKPDQLAVNLPKRLRRLLFPGGQAIRGVRPLVLLLMAGLLSAVGWSAFPTPTPPQTPSVDFKAQPAVSTRGESLPLVVTNTNERSDCDAYSLKGAVLTAAAGSGITIAALNLEDEDCRMAAQVNIASDAPTGTTELTIKKGDTNIGSFPFEVIDQPFPRLFYMPNQSTQGETVSLTIFGDKGMDCTTNSLKTATLSAPPESGITIRNLMMQDCEMTASLRIAPNAPVGTVNLTLSRGGLTAPIPFTINQRAKPDCPSLTVSCPSGVQPGNPLTLTAKVTGGHLVAKPRYIWKATIVITPNVAYNTVIDQATDDPSVTVTYPYALPITALWQISLTVTGYNCPLSVSRSCSVGGGIIAGKGRFQIEFQNTDRIPGASVVDLQVFDLMDFEARSFTNVELNKQPAVTLEDLPYGLYRLLISPKANTGISSQIYFRTDNNASALTIDAATQVQTYPVKVAVTYSRAKPLAEAAQDQLYGPAVQQSGQQELYDVVVKTFNVKTGEELKGIDLYYIDGDSGRQARKLPTQSPSTIRLAPGHYTFFAAKPSGANGFSSLSAYEEVTIGAKSAR
ncbi:MAG: hypothetical protein ACJ74J_14585 [Blastocatellia bacterium]